MKNESGEEVGQMYSVFTTVGKPGTEMVTSTRMLENGQIVSLDLTRFGGQFPARIQAASFS